MNLTYSEIISTLLFIGGLIGVWLDARLRINTLEAMLKFFKESLEKHVEDNEKDSQAMLSEIKQIICDNKEFAKDNSTSLASLSEQITDLRLLLVQNIIKKEKNE